MKKQVITHPPKVEIKNIPDYRFKNPRDLDENVPIELEEQIYRFVENIRSALKDELDPVVDCYDNDKFYVEEVKEDPAKFELGSLISQFCGSDRSEGHHTMDIPSYSVLAYYFSQALNSSEPAVFADEHLYFNQRLRMLRGFSFGSSHMLMRADPFVVFVPFRSPLDQELVLKYLQTDEERRIYKLKCEAEARSRKSINF